MTTRVAPIVKMTRSKKIEREIAALYERDPNSPVFKDDYLKEMRSICDRMMNWGLTVSAIAIPAYILLLVDVFATRSPTFTIFGMTLADVPGIREYVLLGIAAANLFTSVLGDSRLNREDVCKAIVAARFTNVERTMMRLIVPNAFYTAGDLDQSSDIFKRHYGAMSGWQIFSALTLLLAVVIGLVLGLILALYVVYTIIRNPDLSLIYEIPIVGLSVALWVASMIVTYSPKIPRHYTTK